MDIAAAETLMNNAIKGFHGRFKKIYGQISLRVDENTYLSTGGNKSIAGITEDSFELCDINSGDLGTLFRARSDINAIIFGCSTDTVKASSDRDELPVALEDLAMITGPYLKVIPDSSPAAILRALRDSSVCLIKGVGAIAVGSNFKKAVAGIQIVEKACEAEVHGALIGGTVPINKRIASELRQDFISDYTRRNETEHGSYIGFDEKELDKRNTLIQSGKALLKRDLSYGSWGNLSLRHNSEEMLITPSSMDYFEIALEDIVKLNIHTLDRGKQRVPSSESPMHAMIYRTIPDCQAIIHTHSNGISVFAACEAGFSLGGGSIRDLIGDVKVTPYAPAGSEKLARIVADTLKETHACIIPHHGAVFYGPSLDVVLAVADAVEQRARNILGFNAPAGMDL
jgi:ribulose-5-phosphate 4-epimerase/fuculose-1-phosphate aldolase